MPVFGGEISHGQLSVVECPGAVWGCSRRILLVIISLIKKNEFKRNFTCQQDTAGNGYEHSVQMISKFCLRLFECRKTLTPARTALSSCRIYNRIEPN